jgi:Domain of unknown function (DUF4266)
MKFDCSFKLHAPIDLGILCCLCLISTGCAFAPPAPWERGALAKSSMKFDADRLEALSQQHVYFSKEAASGGAGVGGGGCGCN